MTVVAFPSVEPPFPHVLAPLPEESLLSFMFRLDGVNGWPIGETAKLLSTHSTGWRRASATMWAAGTVWDLRRLAHLSTNPFEAIEALTYLPDLRAATNRPELGIGSLGDSGDLRYCPVCLATTGAILRFCFLPLVTICPLHEVRMERFCPGHVTAYDRSYTYPPVVDGDRIRCAGCEHEIGSVEGRRVDEEALAHLRDTWRAWTFLLGWRGDDIRGRGYRTIRAVRRGYPLRNVGQAASFERLVTVFLALQIEPELVATLEDRPIPPCPNAACGRYVAGGPDDPLERGRPVERHCSECGARFIGRRILLCFDPDHGGTHPSTRSVRKAQRRLRRWREALAEVCREDILAGRQITVGSTFRRAGIPRNANLRASRLGLVTLVRDAARRQRLLEHREPAAFDATTMAEYRAIAAFAADGRWDDLADTAALGWIRPNVETPPFGYFPGDPRFSPRHGLLDPLFPPAWVVRHGADPNELRASLGDLSRCPPGWLRELTPRWDERVAAVRHGRAPGPVVAPTFYASSINPHSTAPDVVAFVCGEWSPEWMPEQLSCRPAPPADPFG